MYNYIVRYKFDPEKRKMVEFSANQDTQVMEENYKAAEINKENKEQQSEFVNIEEDYHLEHSKADNTDVYFKEWEDDRI